MADFINLTCPSCGGKLQVTNDIDRFACGYCGNEQLVKRSGGIVTLAPVVEGLRDVKAGVDKTASELAIARLEADINNLYQQRNNVGLMSGCVVLLFIGTAIFSLSSLLAVFTSEFGGGSIFLLFVTVTLITITLFIYDKNQKAEQQRVAPIDNAIAERARELEYHRAIVQGK